MTKQKYQGTFSALSCIFHVLTAISGGVDISEALGYLLLQQMSYHKNYFKDWCFMNSQSPFLFLACF